MKFMIFCLLLFLATLAVADCGKSGDFCHVKVVSVYDGDTFKVNIPRLHDLFGKKLGIRLQGVDTPEMRGGSAYEKSMAKKAKEFTKNALLNAKRVDLIGCFRGKYFRIVCKVIYDKKNLSDELIKADLAVEYLK